MRLCGEYKKRKEKYAGVAKDLQVAPGESNLGLGCGNPISGAGLRTGENVLDIGSGTGFDAFPSAEKVVFSAYIQVVKPKSPLGDHDQGGMLEYEKI